MILGCPPTSKNFQKGTLGGSRCGQKGIKRGCKKEQPATFLAHCPRSKKRTSVAKRIPSRKPSMLLSHKDYYCFLRGLAARGPRKTVCGIKCLTSFCQKWGSFWDPLFFTCGPLGPKKGARGFNTGTWWLLGRPRRPRKLRRRMLILYKE